ncbi:hypothetical protein ACFQ3Z_44035 [Streptomyces nogalater]
MKATHLEQGVGTGAIAGSASEAGDRMGHTIAAAVNDSGLPYLVIGLPGKPSATSRRRVPRSMCTAPPAWR